MTETTTPAPEQARTGGFNWKKPLGITALVLVSAFAGAAASKAAFFWHMRHHGPGFMMGTVDPAVAERGAERMAGFIARDVKASDEQKTKLETIAKGAVKDLLPLREKLVDGRKKARDLLAAPTVDRAAVEALRTEQVANVDALTKRMATAITDAAEVLTPEQRKEFADHMPPFGGPGWHKQRDRD